MQHIEHLNKDKKLAKILANQQPYVLKKQKLIYYRLCNSIMSQQLSTKVADVFQQRFLDLFDGYIPSPEQIISIPFETLRGIGLSNNKAAYIQNVAQFFSEQKITDTQLNKLSDEEVIKLLTQIKGVGRWTVEMILMFSLGREDVFAIDDLAIQQTMAGCYKLDMTDKKEFRASMIKISSKWSPYRTYACRYLWGWKDGA